uniref:Uncharacterized protein n=1 Tax=Amphimedon queenslandica TaxID=400682 RepID=A0A1X7TWK8_AMPQE
METSNGKRARVTALTRSIESELKEEEGVTFDLKSVLHSVAARLVSSAEEDKSFVTQCVKDTVESYPLNRVL